MNSKTIILSSPTQSNSGRGILSIYIEDDLLKCKLRLYNISKLSAKCKLGIYHKEQVYSANLLEKKGAYESSFVGEFDLNENFYVALVNTENNNDVIISGGTYAGFYFNEDNTFNPEQIKDQTPLITEETKPQKTNCEDNACSNCQNCIYKQHFYAKENNQEFACFNQQTAESTPPIQTANSQLEQNPELQPVCTPIENNSTNPLTPEKTEEKPEIKPNMQNIINQFNYVFENYPLNQEINTLIPNGKFVTINENEEEYSIGVIYNNDQIKYLCYAVKSRYNTEPPQEIGEHYQWLPLDVEDPLSDGYYIVFQDTEDLKILDLN